MEQNVGANTSNKTSIGVGGELINKKQELLLLTEIVGVRGELMEQKEGTRTADKASRSMRGTNGTKCRSQYF